MTNAIQLLPLLFAEMTYSCFIWGSEPRDDGTFHPWEIYNVIPECPEWIAKRMLDDAIKCNPGVQIAMTEKPKVPDILSGQCSKLY